MDSKKRLISLCLFSFLFVAIALIGTWKIQSIFAPVQVKDTPTAPEDKKTKILQKKAAKSKKRRHIKPIVIEDKFFNRKPDSLEPADWDAYNRKKIEKMKSQMSPELLKKLDKEFKERDNPEVEENIKKFDESIEELKQRVEKDPTNIKNKKMLQKLLNIQSKNKYMRELFMNRQ